MKLLKASDDILIVPDCSLVLNALEEECKPYFSNDFKTLYIPTTKGNEDLLLIKPGDPQR